MEVWIKVWLLYDNTCIGSDSDTACSRGIMLLLVSALGYSISTCRGHPLTTVSIVNPLGHKCFPSLTLSAHVPRVTVLVNCWCACARELPSVRMRQRITVFVLCVCVCLSMCLSVGANLGTGASRCLTEGSPA